MIATFLAIVISFVIGLALGAGIVYQHHLEEIKKYKLCQPLIISRINLKDLNR
jgi:hypothetical protein